MRELAAQHVGRETLHLVDDVRRGMLRVSLDEQVNMVQFDLQHDNRPVVLGALGPDRLVAAVPDGAGQDRAAVLRAPHDVIAKVAGAAHADHHPAEHPSENTGTAGPTGAGPYQIPCRLTAPVPSGGP